ncbi:MAG TPA: SdpI family protein [Chthoniobacterales bacterium]
MSGEAVALSSYFITGIVFILVSIPLLFNRIGPNWFYGVRIRKAYESTEMWYKVNRLGAKFFLGYGIVLLAIGAILWFASIVVPLTPGALGIGNVLLILTSVVHLLTVCSRVS